MGKHLVLVGGGHAHMVTLANLDKFIKKGHGVTVIGPSEYHYYSGMGPGMLSRTYTPEEIRFATRHVVEKQGGVFLKDSVVRLEPDKKKLILESGQEVPYDVVSCNAGSYVPDSIITGSPTDIFFVKPIEGLIDAKARILELVNRKRIGVAIVGGGPSSAEIAGNVLQLVRSKGGNSPDIKIVAGKRFMAGFPEGVRKRVIKSITHRGIEILEQGYAEKVETGRVTLESGRVYDVDIIFMAVGVKPSPIFERSGLPTGPDHGLLVNQYLQSEKYPEIFGGGDCICFKDTPLDKVGVYAVRQNPVLFQNLMASLEGGRLRPFDPGGDYLLIFNLGNGIGVLKKKWLILGGKTAFAVKDWIDRKFMEKFQAME